MTAANTDRVDANQTARASAWRPWLQYMRIMLRYKRNRTETAWKQHIYFGEKSPSYGCVPSVAAYFGRFSQYFSQGPLLNDFLRLYLVLRDPVARTWSDMWLISRLLHGYDQVDRKESLRRNHQIVGWITSQLEVLNRSDSESYFCGFFCMVSDVICRHCVWQCTE